MSAILRKYSLSLEDYKALVDREESLKAIQILNKDMDAYERIFHMFMAVKAYLLQSWQMKKLKTEYVPFGPEEFFGLYLHAEREGYIPATPDVNPKKLKQVLSPEVEKAKTDFIKSGGSKERIEEIYAENSLFLSQQNYEGMLNEVLSKDTRIRLKEEGLLKGKSK